MFNSMEFGPAVRQNLKQYIIARAPRATALYFFQLYMGDHNAKRHTILIDQQIAALDWDMEEPLMNVVLKLDELVRDRVSEYSGSC